MPLNAPEKIASLYLRLNGFFLMSHFTVFSSEHARQTDLLALRPPNAREVVGDSKLLTDARFLKTLGNPSTDDICVVAEVKGDKRREQAQAQLDRALSYDVHMFGNHRGIRKVVFCKQGTCIKQNDEVTQVSVEHCLWWIFKRLAETQNLAKEAEGISKYGSWTWSEEFLSDLLYLSHVGVTFTLEHTCET